MATEQEFNRSMQNFQNFHSRVFSASIQRRASEQNTKMQFRQAAMTSIYKGIKNNDISYILGQHNRTATQGFLPQLNKTEQNVDIIEIDEKSELTRRLAELRRKHDVLKNKANKNEVDIERLKQENKALIDEEEQLNTLKDGVFKEEEKLKDEEENTGFLMQDAEWTKKSYLFMRDRLKKDKIAFQLKQQSIEEELSTMKRCYQQADYQSQMSKQYSDNAQRILDEMLRNVETEKNSIDNKLNSFKNQLILWEDNEKKKHDRSYREKEIAEHAIYDKDAQEKKLRSLMLVHKFLSGMFKDKMEREMKKFSIVEESFQKIKTATGQSEMKNIVSKFLSREQTYGELLGQIANHEKKIDYIKKRNEGLEDRLIQLKQELAMMEQQIAQKKNKGGNQQHEFLKQIEAVEERRKLAELMKEKLYQFCIKIMHKYDKVCREKPRKYSEEFGKENIQEAFESVHKIIMSEVQGANQVGDIEGVLSELEKTKIEKEIQKEDFQRRNVRIKPTFSGKQHTTQSRDSSQNSKSTPNNSSYYESDSDSNIDEQKEFEYFDFMREARKNEDEIMAKKLKTEKEKEATNAQPPLKFQSPTKQ